MMEFKKFVKNCPWKIWMGWSGFGDSGGDYYCHGNNNLLCCRENCAFVHWEISK